MFCSTIAIWVIIHSFDNRISSICHGIVTFRRPFHPRDPPKVWSCIRVFVSDSSELTPVFRFNAIKLRARRLRVIIGGNTTKHGSAAGGGLGIIVYAFNAKTFVVVCVFQTLYFGVVSADETFSHLSFIICGVFLVLGEICYGMFTLLSLGHY